MRPRSAPSDKARVKRSKTRPSLKTRVSLAWSSPPYSRCTPAMKAPGSASCSRTYREQQVVLARPCQFGRYTQELVEALVGRSTAPSAATIRMPSSVASSATRNRGFSTLDIARQNALLLAGRSASSSRPISHRLAGATMLAVTRPVTR